MNKDVRNLRAYLDSKLLDVIEFSKITKINHNTLYAIVKGKRKARRKTASIICRATDGFLTLKDFGYI